MPTQDKNRQSRMNTDSTALADPIVILKNDENEKGSSNNDITKFNKFSSTKQREDEANSSRKDRLDVSGKHP